MSDTPTPENLKAAALASLTILARYYKNTLDDVQGLEFENDVRRYIKALENLLGDTYDKKEA